MTLKKTLEPRRDEGKEGKRYVFFVDAAHFLHAPFLRYVWFFTRPFIQAPAGRKHFNVLGALNAYTHEIITVTNDKYINAVSVCELFIKIAERHDDKLITIVLDNARYQKGKLVKAIAETLQVELLFLPPY